MTNEIHITLALDRIARELERMNRLKALEMKAKMTLGQLEEFEEIMED